MDEKLTANKATNFEFPAGAYRISYVLAWISFISSLFVVATLTLILSGQFRPNPTKEISWAMIGSLAAFFSGFISVLLQIMQPKARKSKILIPASIGLLISIFAGIAFLAFWTFFAPVVGGVLQSGI